MDQINKYITFNCMPMVSSQYWNMVHGSVAEDAPKDEEGMKVMDILAEQMAWLLKCIEAGKKAGIEAPAAKTLTRTNFIR